MKLHADKPDLHTITSYGDGWIAINGQRHAHSLVLSSSGLLVPWPCTRFEDLSAAHFEQLLTDTALPPGWVPELVLFGSGARLRFVRPALLQSLIDRRIGVETMDTLAACRTHNILAGEGRRVLTALLMEN